MKIPFPIGQMSSRRGIVAAVLFGLAAGTPARVGAQEAASLAPGGLRVFVTGHSFHVFIAPMLDQLARAAAIDGHQLVGQQSLGGSTVLRHWEVPDADNQAKAALMTGNVDVLTMSPVVAVPDEGIARFTSLGLKHNPKLRIVVQASWVPGEQPLPVAQPERTRWLANPGLRDETPVASVVPALNDFRTRIEAQVDQLNRDYGRIVLTIVPAGNAVLELRQLVEAGTFPGITKQSELFRDATGHGRGQIRALTAYCNFAVIYKRSPSGLKLDLPEVSAEQDAILQKLAWEVVSRYKYSGVELAPAGPPRRRL